MKGEIGAAKRASMARKRLSDITNAPMAFKILGQDSKSSQASEISRAYVDQLIQEKNELVKLLEERNKIIEMNGMELQRLRGSYQMSQFQNWNLAKTNSQMLAELNVGKEKLKALQHELACKNALLRAKNLELERKVAENSLKAGPVEVEQETAPKDDDKNNTVNRNNRRHQRTQSLGVPNLNKQEAIEKENVENKRHCARQQSARFVSQECEPAADNLQRKVAENSVKAGPVEVEQEAAPKDVDKNNTVNRNNRRHQRTQSLGVPNLNKQEGTEKESVENKRHCVRRQSERFVSQECEPAADNLFEIEEAKFPLRKSLQTLMREFEPFHNERKENHNSSTRAERVSIVRPLRRAAEKVQSYKETPVNAKMRRER